MTAAVFLNPFQSNRSIGLAILTILAILLVFCLISLVEMVVLQLLHWGNTRQSMKASLAMNLISCVAGSGLLFIFSQPDISHLLIAWFLLVAIEGALLNRIRPGTPAYSWFVAAVANLASYIILILPAFLTRG